MKTITKLLAALKARFDEAAPGGFMCALVMGMLLIIAGTESGMEEFTVSGAGLLGVEAAVLIPSLFFGSMTYRAPKLSEYDEMVIDSGFRNVGAFVGGIRRRLIKAVNMLHEGNAEDALDELRELKNECIDIKQKGVISFYTSICYRRLGYPTNAGHEAAEAAQADIMRNDSLLMAARSFKAAHSSSMAVQYYETLLPIAEEKMIFPFVFNEAGWVYVSANEPKAAIACFDKSMEYGLDPSMAHGGMALACLLDNRPDEACEWYRLALISDISDIDSFKRYSGEICTAYGYPENFFEAHLQQKYKAADTAQTTAV